jgi:dTDP-4-amino-4,6-dideoxygalactose transaminase
LEQVHQGRAAVFDALRKAGIGVNVHYIPVHLQPYYQELGFKPGDFPQAESYYDAALTLPLFAGMTDRQQDEVVSALSVILNGDKA